MKRKAVNRARVERQLEQTEAKLHQPTGAMLDAATLTGAVAGAALGAIAGPPGIVAGGIVGTALGVVAGIGLDKAQHAYDRRDKELDDEIGVTHGDLGVREGSVPPPPPPSAPPTPAEAGWKDVEEDIDADEIGDEDIVEDD